MSKRVFINNDGLWYKAKAPKDPSHAERMVVTEEFMQALKEDVPQHLIDIEAKVQQILNAQSEGKGNGTTA